MGLWKDLVQDFHSVTQVVQQDAHSISVGVSNVVNPTFSVPAIINGVGTVVHSIGGLGHTITESALNAVSPVSSIAGSANPPRFTPVPASTGTSPVLIVALLAGAFFVLKWLKIF